MLRKRDSVYKRFAPAAVPPDSSLPAYWFIFQRGQLLIVPDEDNGSVALPLGVTVAEWEIKPLLQQYLGVWNDFPCYAVQADVAALAPVGMEFRSLYILHGLMAEDLFYLAGRANQLMFWDETHRYCSRCGQKMVQAPASGPVEYVKRCPSCDFTSYPRISPAVITAILRGKQILLAHARHFAPGRFSLIAGFVEPGETLEDAVEREIREEVGLAVTNIRYMGSQQWPFPHSLMIGYVADYADGEITVDGDEITEAGWFDADNLPDIPGEISIARKIIDWYTDEYGKAKESGQ